MKHKAPAIILPEEGCHEVLLHACCAPCSSAIVEWMLQNDVKPTIYYFNPNIWPPKNTTSARKRAAPCREPGAEVD